jgi:hypothetical protein
MSADEENSAVKLVTYHCNVATFKEDCQRIIADIRNYI